MRAGVVCYEFLTVERKGILKDYKLRMAMSTKVPKRSLNWNKNNYYNNK